MTRARIAYDDFPRTPSDLHRHLVTLLDRGEDPQIGEANVIPWASPVMAFGDAAKARVATLGLNPSRREFLDESDRTLDGTSRRLHTLESLGLRSWGDADAGHIRSILVACRSYFHANPYRQWFDRLDRIVRGVGLSFYDEAPTVCHVDLVPYATHAKWGELSVRQRGILRDSTADIFGEVLRDSPIEVLILNGRGVVDEFESTADIELEPFEIPAWNLRRESGPPVPGVGFVGSVRSVSGIDLGRDLRVFGFNHNLQSSFGVTNEVVNLIGLWLQEGVLGHATSQ